MNSKRAVKHFTILFPSNFGNRSFGAPLPVLGGLNQSHDVCSLTSVVLSKGSGVLRAHPMFLAESLVEIEMSVFADFVFCQSFL